MTELTDRVNFPCSVKCSQNEWFIRSVICIEAEEMNRYILKGTVEITNLTVRTLAIHEILETYHGIFDT